MVCVHAVVELLTQLKVGSQMHLLLTKSSSGILSRSDRRARTLAVHLCFENIVKHKHQK